MEEKMPFTFLMVPKPDDLPGSDLRKWLEFRHAASITVLQNTDGVFWISDTAWLFDMRKALPAFGRVFHEAAQRDLQLFSVQFEGEDSVSRVWIHPQMNNLTKFLSS